MKSKWWIFGFLFFISIPLSIVAFWMIKVDPYFHFHKPDTTGYYYSLYNQRSQNDGILRHFEYEGLITGSSMTENFKTSEAESLFGCVFVKAPYSGGTYKELNDNLKVALKNNPNLKIIIRGLDMMKFIEDKDAMRTDLGEYPEYLYNDNPLDDVQYIFNRDVFFRDVYGMVTANDKEGFCPGIESFDEYSNWMGGYSFGVHSVYPEGIPTTDRSRVQEDLTEEEKEIIRGNIKQNVTGLAEMYPDVTFYYFITPYSAAWWQEQINLGTFEKQIQAERMVIEEILKCKNIRLYSFNLLTCITTDLNNYKDNRHYGEWVNSLILRLFKDDGCLLTEANYDNYLEKEAAFYRGFDYEEYFRKQQDYDDDLLAEKKLSVDSENGEE